ncbi:MAG: SemiSWEET family sugar transporter [Burkholderiales bacterium]|jgi:MtN3 and saliva related transmembrane protein
MDGLITGIGFLAGLLTTAAFIPQVWKIYQTKSGKDISGRMFCLFSVGIVLWLVYGMLLGSIPLIVSNVVTLVLSLTILALKYRYSRALR